MWDSGRGVLAGAARCWLVTMFTLCVGCDVISSSLGLQCGSVAFFGPRVCLGRPFSLLQRELIVFTSLDFSSKARRLAVCPCLCAFLLIACCWLLVRSLKRKDVKNEACSRDQVRRRSTGLHRGTSEKVDPRSTLFLCFTKERICFS